MEHQNEYHDSMVAMLELVWGEGFMAPGGEGNVAKMVEGLELEGRHSARGAAVLLQDQDPAVSRRVRERPGQRKVAYEDPRQGARSARAR